jgi:MoaA/NifB/PqqE/SkfB family radical SAM enzyme
MEIPQLIEIEPSNICNLKCEICPRGNEDYVPKSPKVMSFDEFGKIVDSYDYPMKRMQFCGTGEPLYNTELSKIVAYVKSAKNPEGIELISNGILLNDKTSADLIEAGLTRIELSIDGADKKSYEAVRHYDFDAVAANARLLGQMIKGKNVSFGINCVITTLNKDSLADMPAFAQSVGADSLEFRIYETNGQKKKDLAIHDRAYLERLKQIVFAECEERGIRLDFWDIDSVQREGCNLGTEVNINVHSFLTPCYHLPDLDFMKLGEENFSSIWEGEKVQNFLQKMREGNFLKECCCLEAMVKK